MAGEAEAQGWAEKLKIENFVELLPRQTRLQMAELFRQSQVIVSPSTHDGTPNTLLEAMACGCFPVVGDIESLREWITPGVNGLLVDPGDPQALADAIVLGLEHPGLRRRAATHNYHLVEERAEYHKSMQAAELFYRSIH
jgi:glycosyltransferase involved in cell wall biosynthesis